MRRCTVLVGVLVLGRVGLAQDDEARAPAQYHGSCQGDTAAEP